MKNTDTQFDQDFDYVVIGAGTAGCVLASRLSEDPRHRVCLIEAGGSERHPFIGIPAAVGAAIMSPKFGWGLSTVPQEHLGGRRVPLPRGKVLGGSGSINGMAYYRGPAQDFDDWAAMGNPGWSYADLLPYFLRSEHNPEYETSPYHATGGPMGVCFPMKKPNRLCEAFNAGTAALGYEECTDFNSPNPDGYGYRQGTIWKGRRVSTASAYLRPVMRRPNLEVLTHTHTRRVLFEGKRAVGVEIQAGEGVVRRLRAHKEVVVCAGAYHSPHVLLHSGVGDEHELESRGVRPVHHLPAVGRNLQDHPSATVVMDMADSTSYALSWKALPRDIVQCGQYLLKRSGPLASNLFETNAYIRIGAGDRPDTQVVFQPARRNTRPFPIPLGHGFAVAVVCLYPESAGSVRLSGPDPSAAPLIDLALLSREADMQHLISGVKLARRIIAHRSFAPYRAHERQPGDAVANDEDLADYIRQTLTTVHHPASSCRMGPPGECVVNHELKVHGLEGIRVADASVYPRLVGGNTNASVVAIAEKASDMILGKSPPPPLKPEAAD